MSKVTITIEDCDDKTITIQREINDNGVAFPDAPADNASRIMLALFHEQMIKARGLVEAEFET